MMIADLGMLFCWKLQEADHLVTIYLRLVDTEFVWFIVLLSS